MELIVAMAVLATAVVGVGRFASTASHGLRERELSSRIGWELTNAREQIAAWAPEAITAERIGTISFSSGLVDELDDLRWQAQVVPITTPARALQITLTLLCTYQGQPARPAELVFWVPNPSAERSQSGASNP